MIPSCIARSTEHGCPSARWTRPGHRSVREVLRNHEVSMPGAREDAAGCRRGASTERRDAERAEDARGAATSACGLGPAHIDARGRQNAPQSIIRAPTPGRRRARCRHAADRPARRRRCRSRRGPSKALSVAAPRGYSSPIGTIGHDSDARLELRAFAGKHDSTRPAASAPVFFSARPSSRLRPATSVPLIASSTPLTGAVLVTISVTPSMTSASPLLIARISLIVAMDRARASG